MDIVLYPRKVLKLAMEHFWFPSEVQNLLISYYDNFVMRFSTGEFTTGWQRLEVGIAAGCTISVVNVCPWDGDDFEINNTEGLVIKAPLKAFMDDITVLSKSDSATRKV